MEFEKIYWITDATVTGATESEYAADVRYFGMQVSTTGSPDFATVLLEGSIDGVNWYPVLEGGSGSDLDAPSVVFTHFPQSNGPVQISRIVRLNISNISGGTSPTVSVSVFGINGLGVS